MPVCLNCNTELQNKTTEYGRIQFCPKCDSKLISAPIVKRSLVKHDVYQKLWVGAQNESSPLGKSCPTCNRSMSAQSWFDGTEHMDIDICTHCYQFWFDKYEFENLPREQEEIEPDSDLHPKSQEVLTKYKLMELESKYEPERKGKSFIRNPDNFWEYVAGFFGLPVEEDGSFIEFYPFITWAATLLCIVIFVGTVSDLDSVISQFGFIPSLWLRYGGLTIFTSMILHGGWMHLISNSYFLLIFGDNVEDFLGRCRYALLLIGSHVFGLLLHGLFGPDKDIPLIGISGAVSGVMAFYTVMFPKKKIAWVGLIFFRFIKISMRVWVYFLIWMLLQIFVILQQVNGGGDVSGLGHLGGVLVGMTWAFYLKTGDSK
ncbi:rhomboid family intramembrane serine protease [Candidatus Cloacimonadota bacterium]